MTDVAPAEIDDARRMPIPRWCPPDATLLDATCPLPLDRPFTAARAAALGVGRRLLRGLVARGLVREIVHGAYGVAQLRDSIELRVAALGLVVSRSAVVTDRTAAWLHEVDVLPRRAAHEPAPLDVFSRGESRVRRAGVNSGIRQLRDSDVELIEGIAVTTLLRTALDLGRRLPRYDAIGALDACLRRGVARHELEWGVHRFKGHRGVLQLRELVSLADPRAESVPESALRLHGHDAGLTLVPQFVVCDEWENERYRLDLALPELRYAAEYHGTRFHEGEVNERKDERRSAWLAERDWETHTFWKEDLYGPGADPGRTLWLGVQRARQRLGRWRPQGQFLA